MAGNLPAVFLRVFSGKFYRPKYYSPGFIHKFSEMMDLLSTDEKEVLMFGDFNCDFTAKCSIQTESKQLKSLFRTQGYS